ncbi:hypothetical protein RX327_30895 [Bradyrhizobium sp. BEA-2-5]|uniref:hypothetical protein n=1 Tax=Bradyrhizobium sp. BEA-2-5 TaxID=3080015 RepID=UPI00293E8474|nr:hypothetical protein [Bradyrhizobium sp. BEA-2-5]WOH80197.1 hypothetical protein RX327_30895 [Bradyrhizobium sp. BEA-2-5]
MSHSSTRQSVSFLTPSTELGLRCALDNTTGKSPLNDHERVTLEVCRSLLSASGAAMTDGTRRIADGLCGSSNEPDDKPEFFTDHRSDASPLHGLLFPVGYDLGDTPNVVRF